MTWWADLTDGELLLLLARHAPDLTDATARCLVALVRNRAEPEMAAAITAMLET